MGLKQLIFFFFTLIGCLLNDLNGLYAESMSAKQIMTSVEMNHPDSNRRYDLFMTLIDRNQNRQTRELQIYSKSYQNVKKQIIVVNKPPKMKNMGFLMFDYIDNGSESDQWIYIPSAGRPKRIASSDRGGSFMGSDLNYADLVSKPLGDYTFRIIKEARVKEQDTWLIESLPVSEEVIRKTGYLKSVLAVTKNTFDVIRIKLWCEDGHTVKLHDLNDFTEMDGIRIPTDILVIKKRGKITMHMTHMKISNLKMGHHLADELFTLRQLERGLSSEQVYP